MTVDELVDAKRTLEQYSDLHDGEIEGLNFTSDRRLVLSLSGHNLKTDRYERLELTAESVSFLEIVAPPDRSPALENYLFPVERTIDYVSLESAADTVRMNLNGMYGWRIELACQSFRFKT